VALMPLDARTARPYTLGPGTSRTTW
jgi:hypothetical protein